MSLVRMPQADFTQMAPGQGYTEFPQGDYMVTIVDCTVKTNQKPDAQGQPVQRLTPKMRVEMGPGPGLTEFNSKNLYGSYNLTQEGMPYLLGLFAAACGGGEQGLATAKNYLQQCSMQGQLDYRPLLNKRIVVHVTMKNNWPNVSTERGINEWGQPSASATPMEAPPATAAPAMMQPVGGQPQPQFQQPGTMAPQPQPGAMAPQPTMGMPGMAPPQPQPGMMPPQPMAQPVAQPQPQPQFQQPQIGAPQPQPQMPGAVPAPAAAPMQQPQQQPGQQFAAPPPPAGMVPGQTQ